MRKQLGYGDKRRNICAITMLLFMVGAGISSFVFDTRWITVSFMIIILLIALYLIYKGEPKS